MIKRILVNLDNFFYKVLLKNLLKTSKLGYGTIVTGAESGANFEHMYNNRPEGSFIIGRFVDKALLNLPAVHATRGRKEDIKKVLCVNGFLKSPTYGSRISPLWVGC